MSGPLNADTIRAGAAGATGGAPVAVVSVANSALFNSAASERLTRTPAASDDDINTMSCWVYRAKFTGALQYFWAAGTSGMSLVGFTASEQLLVDRPGANVLTSTQLFRGTGWYHIVVGLDVTNAIATNRVTVEVNGVEITTWTTDNRAALTAGMFSWGDNIIHGIGATGPGAAYFDGYIAEFTWMNGTKYSASDFGEYDTTGLYWTPKSSADIQALTFGSQGFYLNNVTNAQTDAHIPAPAVVLPTVTFDGTNDYLSYSGTPMPDGPAGTFSCWFRFDTAAPGAGDYFYQSGGTYFDIRRNEYSKLSIIGYTSAPGFLFSVYSSSATWGVVSSGWHHMVISWNLVSSPVCHMYIDGVSDVAIQSIAAGSINYAGSGNVQKLGADFNGANLFPGQMAQFYLTNEYVDITQASNLAKFITTDGNPVSMGSDGATPTGTAAKLFFNSAVDSWHTNDGTGGGMTETGALTAGSAVQSVNSNNFTNNNTVVTSKNTPTNLIAKVNPLNIRNQTSLTPGTGLVLSNGNMTFDKSSGGADIMWAMDQYLIPGNKYHFEYTTDSFDSSSYARVATWIGPASYYDSGVSFFGAETAVYRDSYIRVGGSGSNQNYFNNSALTTATITPTTGTRITYEVDMSTIGSTTIRIYEDGVLDITYSSLAFADEPYSLGFWTGAETDRNGQVTVNFDSSSFEDTPTTGYIGLSTNDVASATTRTASDTNKYFQTVLYEGNGGGQRVGAFQPFDNTFTVAKSSLFDDANSESLTRSFSTPTSADVWTFSTWLKRGDSTSTGVVTLFGGTYNRDLLFWNGGTYLQTMQNGANALNYGQYLEDASQWFHVMWTQNGTTATGYINGVQAVTATKTNDTINSSGITHYIGNRATQAAPYDGYLAETVFIDGQALAPSNFGEVDTSTNRWVPKAVAGLTFGNNGFYLNYADSSAVGNDVSGNNNDWTNNNTVVQTTDSPTTNFAVLDPNVISGGAVTLSAGNLTQTGGAATVTCNVFATLPMRSGKWIMAGRPNLAQNYEQAIYVANETGVAANTTRMDQDTTGNFIGLDISTLNALETQQGAGVQNVNISPSLVGGTDYTVLAMDADNKKVYIGWHDVSGSTTYWLGNDRSTWNGNPATGAGAFSITGSEFKFVTASYTGRGGTVDFGQGTFLSNVTIPTGYLALSQDNMVGTEQFISAFSWIKNRDATDNHMLFDRVRGATKDWHSNTTDAEVTNVNTVQRFLEAGVQVGNDVQVNTANESYVLWNWMMESTGSGASNEDGTINTTATLVDQTLGMSVSTYTGTGANATIGHGLGVAPTFVIIKRLTGAGYNPTVAVNSGDLNFSKRANLDTTGAFAASSTFFQDTNPSPTVITLGSNSNVNASSVPHVCYAFAPSQFISIGSYSNSSGTVFVPTLNSLGVPIQPVFFLAKTYSAGTSNWIILDNKREGYNVDNDPLYPNTTGTEATTDLADIVTGGIKARANADPFYTTYFSIYMAIGTPIIDVDGRIIAGR